VKDEDMKKLWNDSIAEEMEEVGVLGVGNIVEQE